MTMKKLTFPVLLLGLGVLMACANTLNAATDQRLKQFVVKDTFTAELKKQGFVIQEPELIEKPKTVTGMRQIREFFPENDQSFFTYTRLNSYLIKNVNNKKIVQLYCYQFDSFEAAQTWFNVIAKNKKPLIRAMFRRPKKTMGLSDGYVILLTGFNMSDDKSLRYIMSKLDNIHSVIHAAPRDR